MTTPTPSPARRSPRAAAGTQPVSSSLMRPLFRVRPWWLSPDGSGARGNLRRPRQKRRQIVAKADDSPLRLLLRPPLGRRPGVGAREQRHGGLRGVNALGWRSTLAVFPIAGGRRPPPIASALPGPAASNLA